MNNNTKPSMALLLSLLSLTALVGCASQHPTSPGASPDLSPTSTMPRSSDLEVHMIDAIDAGDPGAVQAILDQGLSPDAPIGGPAADPVLPLHRAAANDQAEIVAVLIDAGATVDATTSGSTPLMLAASSAGPDTIEALLAGGADISRPNPSFYSATAWHLAAKDGNVEALQIFLDAGVDIDLVDTTDTTALIYASFYGETEAVRFLVDHGADPNIRDNWNTTALGWATYNGHTEAAAILEAAGGEE